MSDTQQIETGERQASNSGCLQRLVGRDIICCPDCSKSNGWEKEYHASNLRVLGNFDDESTCFVCGKPKGGACFRVPPNATGLTVTQARRE